jgi:hypothetical protein
MTALAFLAWRTISVCAAAGAADISSPAALSSAQLHRRAFAAIFIV